MKWKVFHTLAEQENFSADGWLEEMVNCEIVTITEQQRTRIDLIKRTMREAERKAGSSTSKTKNRAASLIAGVQWAMRRAREIQPGCKPNDAPDILRAHIAGINVEAYHLSEFFDACVDAAVVGDAKLFTTFAGVLKLPNAKSTLGSPGHFRGGLSRQILHAHAAFKGLQQEGIVIPTKKQVRERALYTHARERVLARHGRKRTPGKLRGEIGPKLSWVLEEEIETEKCDLEAKIPKWPKFWSDAGMKDLPTAERKG